METERKKQSGPAIQSTSIIELRGPAHVYFN